MKTSEFIKANYFDLIEYGFSLDDLSFAASKKQFTRVEISNLFSDIVVYHLGRWVSYEKLPQFAADFFELISGEKYILNYLKRK